MDPESDRLASIRGLQTETRVVLAGVAVTAIAAWLPWAQIQRSGELTATLIGFDLDGFLTLMLAVAVAGLVLVHRWNSVGLAGCLFSGALIVALALAFLSDPVVTAASPGGEVTVSPGIGVYLTMLGGLLIVAGSGLAVTKTLGEPNPPQR